MTPDRAAEVLGVGVEAAPAAIERAFQARARVTHPDVGGGSAEAFREASTARDVLVAYARLGEASDAVAGKRGAYPPGRYGPADGPPPIRFTIYRARPQGPWLLAAWVGILVIAAFFGIYGAPHPFTVAEPLLRWAVLIGAAFAYGRTGRGALLTIAVIAVAATVVLTVLFTSFGGLLSLLLLLPGMLGLSTAGIAQRRFRTEVAARLRPAAP